MEDQKEDFEEEIGNNSDLDEDVDNPDGLDNDDNEEDDLDEDDEDDDDDEFTEGDLNEKKNPIIEEDNIYNYDKKFLQSDSDLEMNDSIEFLQKFSEDTKTDYIGNNHSELLNKNIDEIKKLSVVTRDNNNNIIDEFHKTIPLLTKYEKTKILGIRIKQLNNGSKPFINVNENIIDNNIIANNELQNKVLPFIIVRPLPNRTFEYWKLKDLEVY